MLLFQLGSCDVNKEHSCDDDEQVELQLAHLSGKEYLTSNRSMTQGFQEKYGSGINCNSLPAYLLNIDQDLPAEEIRKTFP